MHKLEKKQNLEVRNSENLLTNSQQAKKSDIIMNRLQNVLASLEESDV